MHPGRGGACPSGSPTQPVNSQWTLLSEFSTELSRKTDLHSCPCISTWGKIGRNGLNLQLDTRTGSCRMHFPRKNGDCRAMEMSCQPLSVGGGLASIAASSHVPWQGLVTTCAGRYFLHLKPSLSAQTPKHQ